ncbi:signal recognition particle 9 kDa protein isoform X2 [Peromyscus californicus insignis]|uniref:signal recognition particle 9 kDa protein isoform X2 n=1 Tax=Peromyscus californicus insignis TaxID=564181 RepID=UPI0022A6F2B3|nr:signal recognition particle 9 kDa protein isoform X2 [Peromyscus californicus insignis]
MAWTLVASIFVPPEPRAEGGCRRRSLPVGCAGFSSVASSLAARSRDASVPDLGGVQPRGREALPRRSHEVFGVQNRPSSRCKED